jgi:hypothetical protein
VCTLISRKKEFLWCLDKHSLCVVYCVCKVVWNLNKIFQIDHHASNLRKNMSTWYYLELTWVFSQILKEKIYLLSLSISILLVYWINIHSKISIQIWWALHDAEEMVFCKILYKFSCFTKNNSFKHHVIYYSFLSSFLLLSIEYFLSIKKHWYWTSLLSYLSIEYLWKHFTIITLLYFDQ